MVVVSLLLRLALVTLWLLPGTWSRPYPPRLYGLLAFLFSVECKLSPVRSIGDNDFLRVISWACWYYHPYLLCYVAIYTYLLMYALCHSRSSTLYQADNCLFIIFLIHFLSFNLIPYFLPLFFPFSI